jgi:MFS family permease
VRARIGTTFQSLTVRNYRLFATGQLIKLFGVWMQFIAQDWLVLELSGNSASALGLVTGLQFTPVLLLTLYGGKLADRYDKRRLLIAANAAFFALGMAMGVLVSTKLITLALVFVFAALMGVVNAIETPVRQAFVSELVEPVLLPNALSLAAATFNSARIVGPAVAGVAIWLVGLGPVFLINGFSYLAPLVFLTRLDTATLFRTALPATRARIRDGLAYVWHREDLLLPILLLFVVGMAGFNFQLTLAVLAKTVFETGPQQFGLLTTALAVGSLAGALASGGRRSRPSVYAVLGSGIVFGLLETLVGIMPTFLVTALLLIPTGFFMIFFAQATNQRLQLGVDSAYRGRVMALFVLVFLGTTPIGGPTIGFLSERFGPRVGIWGGGLVCLIAAGLALAWHLRRSGERIRIRLRPLPRLEIVPAVVTAEAPALAPATG